MMLGRCQQCVQTPAAATGNLLPDASRHASKTFFNVFITSAKKVVLSSLFVCLLATLRKNFPTDLHEISREGWQWITKQTIKFWWRSGSRIRIRIATLVRCALAEVCTVPVLLVYIMFYVFNVFSFANVFVLKTFSNILKIPTTSIHFRKKSNEIILLL